MHSEWAFIGDNLPMGHCLQVVQTQRILLPLSTAASILRGSAPTKELVELILALAVRDAQLWLDGPLAPRSQSRCFIEKCCCRWGDHLLLHQQALAHQGLPLLALQPEWTFWAAWRLYMVLI